MKPTSCAALAWMVVIALLMSIDVNCRERGKNHRNHHHKRHSLSAHTVNHVRSHHDSDIRTKLNAEHEENDYDDGRHAYVMTGGSSSKSDEKKDEDQTLTLAFEKHMHQDSNNAHDVYAYKLPSDLWFIVRYAKNAEGKMDKYMNIVESVTSYLDKLDKDVKTVSVNVKGIETVFRLVSKPKEHST
jgi:hypothetical protein